MMKTLKRPGSFSQRCAKAYCVQAADGIVAVVTKRKKKPKTIKRGIKNNGKREFST
jgi:hypothetical protein